MLPTHSLVRSAVGHGTPSGTWRSVDGVRNQGLRARPTDSLRFISAAEFEGMGRRLLRIEEHVAVRCPCCDAIDVGTRHARICPRSRAQVNQHQTLLHELSRTLKRLRISHQVERSEAFTPERNLPMDVVIRRGSCRGAPNTEYRETSVLLDVTRADSQATVHLRGGCAEHDASAASTFEARKTPTLRSSGTRVLERTESQTYHPSGGKLWAPRGRG